MKDSNYMLEQDLLCPKCEKKQLPRFGDNDNDKTVTAVACQNCGHVVERDMPNDDDIDTSIIINRWDVEGLNALGNLIYDWAEKKGWNRDLDLSAECIGTMITNMHSELSEAWDEIKRGREVYEIYNSDCKEGSTSDKKPEGFVIELADCIIRILHTCRFYGLDIEKAIYLKMIYNHTRPYRHGGKVA